MSQPKKIMTIDSSLLQTIIAFLALAGAGVGAYVSLVQRITRLESVMAMFGQKAAKILHSPTDHLGIDQLLEKYIDHNYDLSFAEWQELLNRCEAIENDNTLSKGERTLAAFIQALSHHKLRLPPPPKKKR